VSSNSSSNGTGGGVTIVGLLGVVFVTLKLVGKITWSWWWVTAPFWAGLALVAAILILVVIFAALKAAFAPPKSKARGRYK
jgi:hypothetical protein